MKLPIIVGIAGTNGSGKDTLGALLEHEQNYVNISLSDILRAELDKLGKPHTRENLSGMSRKIREAEGDGAMSKRAIAAYKQDGRGFCITSIRTPGEVEAIQNAGGSVMWVDADERIRYDRIVASNRGRGATDEISFKEFQIQQHAEMYPSEQGGGLNMAAVKELCDVFLENNFDSLEAYQAYLREYFEL